MAALVADGGVSRERAAMCVCTQLLACNASSSHATALLRIGSGRSRRYVVSVSNHKPHALMYPPTTAEFQSAEAEAVHNVQRAAVELPQLYARHLRWWSRFFETDTTLQGSFVSVPDTRLEGFYWLQQAKLGHAMRADGIPLGRFALIWR